MLHMHVQPFLLLPQYVCVESSITNVHRSVLRIVEALHLCISRWTRGEGDALMRGGVELWWDSFFKMMVIRIKVTGMELVMEAYGEGRECLDGGTKLVPSPAWFWVALDDEKQVIYLSDSSNRLQLCFNIYDHGLTKCNNASKILANQRTNEVESMLIWCLWGERVIPLLVAPMIYDAYVEKMIAMNGKSMHS